MRKFVSNGRRTTRLKDREKEDIVNIKKAIERRKFVERITEPRRTKDDEFPSPKHQ